MQIQNEETDKYIAQVNKKIEVINQKTKELIKLRNYIHNLFPKNYFIAEKKEDSFIPSNWGSISYNILGKHDEGRDLWMDDNNNEWVKAFHGTGKHCKSDQEIKQMIDEIFKNGFKNGKNNVHANHNDINHPGKKIGIGVYVTPNIETAKQYSGIITKDGKKYLTLFLVKVKKKAIRRCSCQNASDYWVINGSRQEIRPLKVLYAEYI